MKVTSTLAGGALLLAAGISALAQAPEAPKNLVVNASMDESLDTRTALPTGWYRFGKSETPYTVEIAEGGRFSQKCLHILGTGDYAGATTNRIVLDPAKRYAARAWIKMDPSSTGSANLKLDFFDDSGKYYGDSKANASIKAGPEGWRMVTLVARGDLYPGATRVAAALTTNGKVEAWFDDAELVEREPDVPGNLLPDGGMEWAVGENLTRWGLSQAPGGTVQKVRRRVPVREGWHCLQLVGKAAWASSDAGGTQIPLDRTKKYTLTGWARARTGSARIKINFLKDGKFLGQQTSQGVSANEWQQQTVVADLSKYPEATQLGVGANAMGEIDAFFDGFVLTAE